MAHFTITRIDGQQFRVLVDKEDLERVCQRKWHVSCNNTKRNYSVYVIFTSINGKEVQITHWLYGKPAQGFCWDHKNGNRFDNRRLNMRLCTAAENSANRRLNGNSTSGVKGLCYDRFKHRWRGVVRCNGQAYVKYSKDRTVVEQWLIEKRKELHGDFARNQ